MNNTEKTRNEKLFDFFAQEYDLALTNGEIKDIIQAVQEVTPPIESVEGQQSDLEFLKEMKGYFDEGRRKADKVSFDMVNDMMTHWIEELEGKETATHPTPESEGVEEQKILVWKALTTGLHPETTKQVSEKEGLEMLSTLLRQAKQEERERMVEVVQFYIDKIESDPQISNQEMWLLRTLRLLKFQLQGGK